MLMGIVGVFAASSFNPREHVQLNDGSKITLAQYAARRRLQLLTAAEFNGKLRDRGCLKGVTVQKVCRVARNEGEVRKMLESIWGQPEKAEEVLMEFRERNEDLYRFEKMLEQQIPPSQDVVSHAV